MRLALGLACALAALACSHPRTDDRRAAPPPPPAIDPGPERPLPPTPPPPLPPPGARTADTDRAPPIDFPADCVTYAGLIDRLGACDRARGARDELVSAYAALRAAWPTVPIPRRGAVAAQCRSQADGLRTAAAAACGW